MISLSRHAIMSSAHRCMNSVVSTMRNRGLSFSVSAAKSAIVSLAAASVASLVAGSHLSSSVFHSPWWMITPYSVLATSVGISIFLSPIAELSERPLALSDRPNAGRLTGVNPEPRPGLHKLLKPGADKLGPPAGHRPCRLGTHDADGKEREPQRGAGSRFGQVEGGNSDADAHVERPGQLQVLVLRPAGHRRDHLTAVLPPLGEKPAKPRVKGQGSGARGHERVSPPAADVLGQRCEYRGGRAADLNVQRDVYGGSGRVPLTTFS